MIAEFYIQRKYTGWHFKTLMSQAINCENLLPSNWGMSFNSHYQTKNKIILIMVNWVRNIDGLIAKQQFCILSLGDTYLSQVLQ